MSYLIVPSDITVLENKVKVGRKAVSWFEWAGLLCAFPLYHARYTKLSPSEMQSVLTKRYNPGPAPPPEVEICMARQAAVHRQVVSGLGWWGGAISFGAGTFWSFRKYNYQSKLICIPFLMYAGTWVGRAVGDILTGRNAEFKRDRFLASLPAYVYYKGE